MVVRGCENSFYLFAWLLLSKTSKKYIPLLCHLCSLYFKVFQRRKFVCKYQTERGKYIIPSPTLKYRGSRDLGLIEHPDDITNCSIDECESSNGYLSTTYKLTAFFKCRSQITGERVRGVTGINLSLVENFLFYCKFHGLTSTDEAIISPEIRPVVMIWR